MVNKDCELCKGSGWYGDNGPGIRGNREYVPCEYCNPKADGDYAVLGDGWRDAMKELPDRRGYYLCYTEKQYNRYVIALWNDFMWSGVCYGVKAWMALPDPPAFD